MKKVLKKMACILCCMLSFLVMGGVTYSHEIQYNGNNNKAVIIKGDEPLKASPRFIIDPPHWGIIDDGGDGSYDAEMSTGIIQPRNNNCLVDTSLFFNWKMENKQVATVKLYVELYDGSVTTDSWGRTLKYYTILTKFEIAPESAAKIKSFNTAIQFDEDIIDCSNLPSNSSGTITIGATAGTSMNVNGSISYSYNSNSLDIINSFTDIHEKKWFCTVLAGDYGNAFSVQPSVRIVSTKPTTKVYMKFKDIGIQVGLNSYTRTPDCNGFCLDIFEDNSVKLSRMAL